MKIAKVLMLGLPVAMLPCIASAVVMPTGVFMEQVDMTFLGNGVILPPAEEVSLPEGWAVQVGAFGDRSAADLQLAHVAAMLPANFAGAVRQVVSVTQQDGRTLYRARLGGFDHVSAQSACSALGQQEQACFVSPEGVGTRLASSLPEWRRSAEISAASASASVTPLTRLASAEAVGDDELQEMRGGFFTAAGAHFDFGANVQTLVNGQLVLQSNLTWTPTGAVTEQLAGLGASIHSQVDETLAKAGINPAGSFTTGAAPLAASKPAVASSAPGVQTPSAQQLSAAAPATVTAPVNAPAVAAASVAGPPPVPGLSGVQIQSPGGGSTQVLANLGGNAIQNIVLNSASNQNIVQNTNVMLTIYNFPAWQQQLAQNAVSAQLAHDVMSAAGLGGSR